MSQDDSTPTAATVQERLAELERKSDERRAELQAVIGQLPASVSRRSLLVSAAHDLRTAPNKADIARRGGRKLLRAPRAIVRRVLPRS